MKKPLTISNIELLLLEAEFSFRHEECATCECYLGYLTQLKLDSDQEASRYLEENIPDRGLIHSCLGCDPCAPGILYSNYLRKNSSGLE